METLIPVADCTKKMHTGWRQMRKHKTERNKRGTREEQGNNTDIADIADIAEHAYTRWSYSQGTTKSLHIKVSKVTDLSKSKQIEGGPKVARRWPKAQALKMFESFNFRHWKASSFICYHLVPLLLQNSRGVQCSQSSCDPHETA